jgi:hypothetical protein
VAASVLPTGLGAPRSPSVRPGVCSPCFAVRRLAVVRPSRCKTGFRRIRQVSGSLSFWLGPAADVHAWTTKSCGSGTSSLSSALDEDLTRPWRGKERVSPPFSGHISPPSPGSVRISQLCKVLVTHEVVHFRYQSQHGIPVDSLLGGTRQIDFCDVLLNSPTGSSSLMHIAVSDPPPPPPRLRALISPQLTPRSVGRLPFSPVLRCGQGQTAPVHGPSAREERRGQHPTLRYREQDFAAVEQDRSGGVRAGQLRRRLGRGRGQNPVRVTALSISPFVKMFCSCPSLSNMSARTCRYHRGPVTVPFFWNSAASFWSRVLPNLNYLRVFHQPPHLGWMMR